MKKTYKSVALFHEIKQILDHLLLVVGVHGPDFGYAAAVQGGVVVPPRRPLLHGLPDRYLLLIFMAFGEFLGHIGRQVPLGPRELRVLL